MPDLQRTQRYAQKGLGPFPQQRAHHSIFFLDKQRIVGIRKGLLFEELFFIVVVTSGELVCLFVFLFPDKGEFVVQKQS
jgi:hypothetical protein